METIAETMGLRALAFLNHFPTLGIAERETKHVCDFFPQNSYSDLLQTNLVSRVQYKSE